MITRSLPLLHGRRAISRTSPPSVIRQWRRALSATPYICAEVEQNASQGDVLPSDTASPPLRDGIVADWEFYQHQRAYVGNVGAAVTPHYKPISVIRNPPKPEHVTLELLLASQTHLGHRTSLWHPANAQYIFGTWGQAHDAIHVISLDVTAAHLRRACKVVSAVAAKGGLILFIGTRSGHTLPVVRAAELSGGCHLFDKWTPGTLTNGQQMLARCAKKVVNELDEELLGFEPQLKERAVIRPDLVVCLNPLENYVALSECGKHNIPTIGIVDTDVNPTWVTYPIPANDDSLRSVSLIAGVLGRAGEEGLKQRLARAKAGAIDYVPAQQLRLPTREEVSASKRSKDNALSRFEDEDEENIIATDDYAMYEATDAIPTSQAGETSEQQVDELNAATSESHDEALVNFTDFAGEVGVSQLTTDDRKLLAESTGSDAVNDEAPPPAAQPVEAEASVISDTPVEAAESAVSDTPVEVMDPANANEAVEDAASKPSVEPAHSAQTGVVTPKARIGSIDDSTALPFDYLDEAISPSYPPPARRAQVGSTKDTDTSAEAGQHPSSGSKTEK